MPLNCTIRSASIDDAAAIQAIYAPYVSDTVISFEASPPTVDEVGRRISGLLEQSYPYLVAQSDNRVVGYAYGSPHRARAAYRRSVDVSVYLSADHQRRGIGRQLYRGLIADLANKNYHAAFAGITLPNLASVALHESLGFTHVGTYVEVGTKFDQWHDVGWWQRLLS